MICNYTLILHPTVHEMCFELWFGVCGRAVVRIPPWSSFMGFRAGILATSDRDRNTMGIYPAW
jgi:hypothetical protein